MKLKENIIYLSLILLVDLNKSCFRMIHRFSSTSNAFSFINFDDGAMLSWTTTLEFCRSSQMSLISVLVFPFDPIDSSKLIHVSSNICSANLTNPNAYIYSCTPKKPGFIFQKGKIIMVSNFILKSI